jgi:murein DD-endopeptidase MepM/ murein hydrolase activator NlpD
MTALTCFYEPIRGAGRERRDELGNTAPYRTQPHRGSDWGFTNGSEGKDIYAIHAGKVTKIENNPALGWTVYVKSVCVNPACAKDTIEYNHMLKQPLLKVGDEVKGNYQSLIGLIGATGSSLSKAGANHLHASCAPESVPHAADRKVLKDLFKLIDESSKNRKANMEAKKAATA